MSEYASNTDKNVEKVVKLQEKIKVELKQLIKEAMILGMSKEDVDEHAKELINKFLKDNKNVKLEYKKLYDMWVKLLYGNFQTMYKISVKTLNRELTNDKISKEVSIDLKKAYKSDVVKKESYVFKSNDEINTNDLNVVDTPSLKFIRTSAEYGYTQMQIDNYVERVERTMDKIAQINFIAVNNKGARISLRNKAEMEVRYQDMLSDLDKLKDEKFVLISQHKDSSLRCACWQGLIYLKDTDGTNVNLKDWHEWNSVKHHIAPKEIGRLPDGQPYYSLKEAMEHGLFSYNCRHRFIKYELGTKVPKQYSYNPDVESESSLIDKKMRQLEQNIRRAKERQTLSLTPKERKTWQKKSKILQAQYNSYCKTHNRVRNDWRTSIGIIERGSMRAVENETKEPYISPKSNKPNETEAIVKEVPTYVKVTANYKSDEYKNKIDELGFSKIQSKAIHKGIKRIFNNIKSESREGFYAIDLNNPKKKFYNGDGEVDSVRRPDELMNYTINNSKANIITIHNHRGDSYPSINDLYANSYKYMNKLLVIGNKGTLYYCDCSKANREMIEFDFFKHKTYNEDEFKEFCKKANVKFRILKEALK